MKIVRMHSNKLSRLVLSALLAAGAPLVPVQAQMSNTLTLPAAQPASGPVVADQIVATVNNEVITRNELNDRMNTIQKNLVRSGTALPPRNVLEKQVLDRMITDRAQLEMAKEEGIRVDDTQLDRSVARIAEQNNMSVQVFRDRVEQEGTPYVKFREDLRTQIIMDRLREREVDSSIQVGEGEIDNFLAEQTGASSANSELDIAQILVRVPEQASAEQIEKARQRADDLFRQAQGGADFTKLAVSYSDASDALKGGDLGWRAQDRYPQLFLDAVLPLNAGQIAAPVKSPNGFHILKLVGKRSTAPGVAGLAPVQQTHARHILVRVSEVLSTAQAKAKLEDIRQRIVSGSATFEDMARSYGQDGTSAKGGDLGTLLPGDTVPAFERAMDALKPGEISQPVETQFGWHLIQVIDRSAQALPQDRLRQVARQTIRERKIDEAYQDWIRQVRDRAFVDIRLDDKS